MAEKPLFTLTPSAVSAIKQKTALNPQAIGLRLTIKSTGCSGNSYKMEHAVSEDLGMDDKIAVDGAVLYIPKMHSWMLFGMEIDYAETAMQSGFIFNNPNEAGRCGCGESFTVNKPEKTA